MPSSWLLPSRYAAHRAGNREIERTVRRREHRRARNDAVEARLDQSGRTRRLTRRDADQQDREIGGQHGDPGIVSETGETEVQAMSVGGLSRRVERP